MGQPPSSRRNIVFWGFWAFVGGMLFLSLAALVIVLWFDPLDAGPHTERPPITPLVCLIPVVFIVLGILLGSIAFRLFGRPFADVVSATQAIAKGDLSVRLVLSGPKDLQEMAKSFNSMTEELARADQQRRNLTADIAHELRNPLHVIQGNLEGMIYGVYEPTTAKLEATLAETRLLARLVSDLQTLSLAETGQLPLHPTRFPLTDLLADVVASFSAHAAELGIDLHYEADANPTLLADYDRLDQALSNLTTNALRYTSAGGRITLRAESRARQVQITVSDTGLGISTEDLPFIFDRFWKGERARTRDGSSGSGLGLAISRQLVRAHGGDIVAANLPEQGAAFIITLPLTE